MAAPLQIDIRPEKKKFFVSWLFRKLDKGPRKSLLKRDIQKVEQINIINSTVFLCTVDFHNWLFQS